MTMGDAAPEARSQQHRARAAGEFDPTAFMSPTGGTLHAGHACVQYQVPVDARRLPLVMWHGGGQLSKTWETTPDGRDGYQNIFLRRGWSVYLIDQARRGRARQTTLGEAVAPLTTDASLWQIFRLGIYPRFFDGTQFPATPYAIDQYWRQCAPTRVPSPIPSAPSPIPR